MTALIRTTTVFSTLYSKVPGASKSKEKKKGDCVITSHLRKAVLFSVR